MDDMGGRPYGVEDWWNLRSAARREDDVFYISKLSIFLITRQRGGDALAVRNLVASPASWRL